MEALNDLEVKKYGFRNDIIQCLVPEKLFEQGHLFVFDKILSMIYLRKKVLQLIFSLYENELVIEEEFVKPPEEADPIDEIDAESQTKKIKFYYEVIYEYSEFYCILLFIEMYLSKLTAQEFLNVTSQKYFASIQFNVRNCYQVIDALISLLKDDSLTENYLNTLAEMKTSNNELKTLLSKCANIGKNKDYLYDIINLRWPYDATSSYKFALSRIDVRLKKEEAKANLMVNVNNLLTGYKNVKKFLMTIDSEFFFNIPYEVDNNIFDTKCSFFTTLKDANDKIMKNEVQFEEYSTLFDYSNQLIIVSNSSIEKYLKNNEENLLRNVAKKRKLENEDYLPVNAWLEITSELKNQLNSTVQIQEDLATAQDALKKEKISNAELNSKLAETIRGKDELGQKLGKAEGELGKVSRLTRELNEAIARNKKFEDTINNLRLENDKYSHNEKELKDKIEKLKKDSGNKGVAKKSRVALIRKSLAENIGAASNSNKAQGVFGDSASLLNTLNSLQRERKFLKSKLIKEKLKEMMGDHNSYMNKYISNDLKISKDFSERDMYNNIKNNVIDLNQDFTQIRKKMAFPKVYDISKKGYSYEEEKEKEINLLKQIKVSYYQNADKVIMEMFGDKTKGRTFKDVIDDDINQTLEYFGENKIKVGKIKVINQEETKNQENEKRTVVPLLLTESSLSFLNSSFLHYQQN